MQHSPFREWEDKITSSTQLWGGTESCSVHLPENKTCPTTSNETSQQGVDGGSVNVFRRQLVVDVAT